MTRPDSERIADILLAHHYHRVDPEQVWTIAVNDVPALAETLTGS